jgi:NAD(P)H dehydrogenase (quinone)
MTLYFQNGILRFCGFDVLRPQLTYDVRTMGQGDRAAKLSEWVNRLQSIWEETPSTFINSDDFDYKRGWLLKDEAISRLLYSPGAPTTGQHLGRPLPLSSQTKL